MNEPGLLETIPIPDPTERTTQQLIRLLDCERDYVNGQIQVLRERLKGMDTANQILSVTVNRVPTETQTSVGRLQDLMDEKFLSIETQFKERDTRQERESRDNKVAVDAAFAAQKEAAAKQDESNAKAIDKSERATAETISKLQDLSKTQNDAIVDKIDDIKQRINGIESRSTGRNDVWGYVVGGVGVVVIVVTLILEFISKAGVH